MPFETREFPELDERYLYQKLEGGPELYLIPKERSQTYVLLQVPFGSLDSTYRIGKRLRRTLPGTAHFLEHKLFANEDGHDSIELLGRLGASGNAYTSTTTTCYLFSCRENLEAALEELFRFVSEPYFTEENIASEKSVIEQEIAMYDDSPSSALYYLAIRAMYERHPIRDKVCGSKSSIAPLDAKRLFRAYRAFYHPSRFRLFISGRFDPKAIEEIASHYASEAPSPLLVRESERVIEDSYPKKQSVLRRMRLHRPLYALGIKYEVSASSPIQRARETIARDLTVSALLGKSGALYGSLYDRGLVNAPSASTVESLPTASYLLIWGESDQPDVVLDEITSALAHAAEHGVSKVDFERMRRVAYSDFLASLDSTEELAEGFASSVADGIDLFTYGRLISEIDHRFASELIVRDFDPRRIVRAKLLPKK